MKTIFHPITQALVVTILGAILLFAVDPAAAASTSTVACPCLNTTNTTGTTEVEMRWEGWVTVVVIFCLLITLVFDFAPASSAMVLSGFILYLAQVVEREDLWVGFTNNGVLAIALFYIIVAPIAKLPITNSLIRKTMSGGSSDSHWWPLLKLTSVSLFLSSFFENTPQVAMFTPLIAKYCAENDLPVAQFLLPMNYATILGNFAVVGCSSTLVISGLMEDEGLGAMNFFELIKIGGPLIPFIMLYLVIGPKFLLPSQNKGSIASSPKGGDSEGSPVVKKSAKKRGRKGHFLLKVKVSPTSSLIGKKYRNLDEAVPGGRDKIEVLKVVRGGEIIDLHDSEPAGSPKPNDTDASPDASSPVDTSDKALALIVEAGDIAWLSATPTTITSCTSVLNVEIMTANNNQANRMIQYYANQQQHAPAVDEAALVPAEEATTSAEPVDGAATEEKKDSAVVEMKETNGEGEKKNEEGEKTTPKQILFDVVLSPSNPSLNRPISAQDFQRRYHAPILAVRCSHNGHDVNPDELSDYILSAGDNLLILAESDFEKNVAPTRDFLMVGALADTPYEKNPYVFVFPRWFPSCCGTLTGGTDPVTQKRVVVIPSVYQYLTLVIFVAIVIAAIFHISLSSLALGGAILYVILGFVSTSQAIKLIHWEVYVMVAFSFPLGAAVKSSGLADVIGKAISDGNMEGLPLLIVISVVTVVMANLITNKATSQVMFQIVISIYKAIDGDPIPAIMVVAMVVVFALCTPFAIPPNVIVLGPGGYSGMDYLKFGLPITLFLMILTPISGALVYNTW